MTFRIHAFKLPTNEKLEEGQAMKTRGACYCGAIRYEAELDENRIGVCHCRDCQIFSGSAFRMATRVEFDDFTITGGTPKYFT